VRIEAAKETLSYSKPAMLMVGFTVTDEIIERICEVDKHPTMPTHKLSWNFVRALRDGADQPVDLISSWPVSDFPRSPWVFIRGEKWDRGDGTENRTLTFINVIGMKHVTRFIGCLTSVRRWLHRHRTEERVVLLYGLNSAHMWATLLGARPQRVPVVAIITDLPSSSTVREPWWCRALRQIDRWLIATSLRRMQGVITLAPLLAQELVPRLPALLVEGIMQVSDAQAIGVDLAAIEGEKTFSVLYAGGLQRSYGVATLLAAFSLLTEPDYKLWIFGKGEMEEEIHRAQAKDKRITYFGFVPSDTLACYFHNASILVNPRPSSDPLTRFCFPSKLLEYMATGRPVLVSRLSGIPDEYASYVTYIEDESATGIASSIKELRARGDKELDVLGRRASEFVRNEKNHVKQGLRIGSFIDNIRSNYHRT
jgi:glycosyltransferase involved in cell wall biosynthesis